MYKLPGKPDIVDLIFDFICCCPHMKYAEGLYETRIQPKVHSRIEDTFRNSQLVDQRQVKAEVGD